MLLFAQARSRSDVTHSLRTPQTPDNTKIIIWDPWEEYDQNQSSLTQPESQFSEIFEPQQIKPIESHNTNASVTSHEQSSYSNPEIINNSPQIIQDCPIEKKTESQVPETPKNLAPEFQKKSAPESQKKLAPESQNNLAPGSPKNLSSNSPKDLAPMLLTPKPNDVPFVPTNECEAAATVCNETILHTPLEDKCDVSIVFCTPKWNFWSNVLIMNFFRRLDWLELSLSWL